MDEVGPIIEEIRKCDLPSVKQLTKLLLCLSSQMTQVDFGTNVLKYVFLKRSEVHRRISHADVLDFDIVNIKVRGKSRGNGYARRFFVNMTLAAEKLGRGVFLEQCIAKENRKMLRWLIEKDYAVGYGTPVLGHHLRCLSVYPPNNSQKLK